MTPNCRHDQPADLCQPCQALRQVRAQFGHHRLLPAPDGGCRLCPLSAMDEIHGSSRSAA